MSDAIISLISAVLSALIPPAIKLWIENRKKGKETEVQAHDSQTQNTGLASANEGDKDKQDSSSEPVVESFSELVKNGKYATAIEVAKIEYKKLNSSGIPNSTNKELALLEFEFWYARALIYTGKSSEGISKLTEIISLHESNEDKALKVGRSKRKLLGRVHNDLGYVNWMELGHYGVAVRELSDAIRYFASVDSKSDELATACDNIGRVYTHMGYRSRAEFLIEHGRQIRLKLDKKDRYALSLISSAISHLAFGDPYRAQAISDMAIREFQTEEDKRKIGLAKIVQGQALRRIGALWIYDRLSVQESYLAKINNSIKILMDALKLFDPLRGGISEPIRQCQINNELGCAYREKFFMVKDDDDYKHAVNFLTAGLEIANAQDYVTLEIEAYEDIAWLCSEAPDFDELDILGKKFNSVEEILDTAELIIKKNSPASLIQTHQSENVPEVQNCIEEFWHQLGKIYTLKAHVLFSKDSFPTPTGEKLYEATRYYILAMGYFGLFRDRRLSKDIIVETTSISQLSGDDARTARAGLLGSDSNKKPELMSHRKFAELLYNDLRSLDTKTLRQLAECDIPKVLSDYKAIKSEWVQDFFGDIAELIIETRP